MTKVPIRFKRWLKWLAVSGLILGGTALVVGQLSRPTLHLCGDSTMADKPLDDNPERGWGQLLPLFFSRDLRIINYARNGRSTKSFIDEGLWARVVNNLRPGDYVLIQFGHNDAKRSDTTRYAAAHTAYRANLIRMVQEARARGANPILITPVNRRKFSADGQFIDQHGDYPVVVREVAAEYAVPMLDLHARSREIFQQLGPERSAALFLRAEPGVYRAFPEGKADNTHFMRQGAIEIARLVVAELRRIDSPLAVYLTTPPTLSTEAEGKIVGLDYYFASRATQTTGDGRTLPVGYTWEDRGDSGYYELGNLFENLGAFLAEQKEAPTPTVLSKLSVYLIVETSQPPVTGASQSVAPETIAALADWVRAGGVLVLIQATPTTPSLLNLLAANWGIQFLPARQVGKVFTIQNLPGHPLFTNLKRVTWEEVGRLQIKAPAKAVLESRNGVVLATAEVGAGLVCALAAPWLNNAYFDINRTSFESESWICGQDFCRWLLSRARRVR